MRDMTMTAEQQAEFDRLLPVVGSVVGQMSGKGYGVRPSLFDEFDARQHGLVGLVEAVQKYDPSVAKVRPEVFARRIVSERIIDGFRAAIGRTNQASIPLSEQRLAFNLAQINTSFQRSEANGNRVSSVAYEDYLAVSERGYQGVDDRDAAEAVLDRFKEPTRSILRAYYLDDLSMREAGEAVNLSESRVSQIMTRLKRDGRLPGFRPLEKHSRRPQPITEDVYV